MQVFKRTIIGEVMDIPKRSMKQCEEDMVAHGHADKAMVLPYLREAYFKTTRTLQEKIKQYTERTGRPFGIEYIPFPSWDEIKGNAVRVHEDKDMEQILRIDLERHKMWHAYRKLDGCEHFNKKCVMCLYTPEFSNGALYSLYTRKYKKVLFKSNKKAHKLVDQMDSHDINDLYEF